MLNDFYIHHKHLDKLFFIYIKDTNLINKTIIFILHQHNDRMVIKQQFNTKINFLKLLGILYLFIIVNNFNYIIFILRIFCCLIFNLNLLFVI